MEFHHNIKMNDKKINYNKEEQNEVSRNYEKINKKQIFNPFHSYELKSNKISVVMIDCPNSINSSIENDTNQVNNNYIKDYKHSNHQIPEYIYKLYKVNNNYEHAKKILKAISHKHLICRALPKNLNEKLINFVNNKFTIPNSIDNNENNSGFDFNIRGKPKELFSNNQDENEYNNQENNGKEQEKKRCLNQKYLIHPSIYFKNRIKNNIIHKNNSKNIIGDALENSNIIQKLNTSGNEKNSEGIGGEKNICSKHILLCQNVKKTKGKKQNDNESSSNSSKNKLEKLISFKIFKNKIKDIKSKKGKKKKVRKNKSAEIPRQTDENVDDVKLSETNKNENKINNNLKLNDNSNKNNNYINHQIKSNQNKKDNYNTINIRTINNKLKRNKFPIIRDKAVINNELLAKKERKKIIEFEKVKEEKENISKKDENKNKTEEMINEENEKKSQGEKIEEYKEKKIENENNIENKEETGEKIKNNNENINNTKTLKEKNHKEESVQRIVRIRKEYMQKGKSQSLRNLTDHFYLILPGNASYLIKNCMCHRTSWKEAFSSVSLIFHFKWQELSWGIDFGNLSKYGKEKQIVNHFENHYTITNKANMFINLMSYCEKRKISVFKYLPFTIIYKIRDRRKVPDEEKEKKWNNNMENLRIFIDQTITYAKEYKDLGDYYNMDGYKEEIEKRNQANKVEENKNKPKYLPELKKDKQENKGDESFNINNDELCSGKYTFYTDIFPNTKNKIGSNTLIELPISHYSGKNMWVIKAINLNRGMCIKVVNNFNDMKEVIEKFKNGVNYHFTEEIIYEDDKEKEGQNNNEINKEEEEKNNEEKEKCESLYYCDKIIIQKYIENPFLYRGRKFDMRIWVLLTHQMKVYIFKEGHLKTCSIVYDPNSIDAYRHITNYSFQKYNDNFEKYEKGNEVPFSEFQKYIDEKFPKKNYKVKEIVTLTMRCAKDKINKNRRNYQFEIFGYDFMIDNDFNIYLIEINTNPGLEISSPWISVIVPRMLDDALRLTIDQLFEPKYDFKLNYKNEEEPEIMKNINNVIDIKEEDMNNVSNEHIKKEEEKANELEEKKDEEKVHDEKNKKYISPFPVPGYDLDENLWELICDLYSKDPLDEFLDKEQNNEKDKETYAGIRHLLNRKKVKKIREIISKDNNKQDNKENKENKEINKDIKKIEEK